MLIDQFKLDPAQYKAVTFDDGPLLVYAGPGAGKTMTLIARTVHLIEKGISPGGIYLATFTRKARAEMSERLGEILDPLIAKRVNIMTIDAIAYRILKAFERVREIKISHRFQVADDEILYQHFQQTSDQIGFKSIRFSLIDAWKEIKAWKGTGRMEAIIHPDLIHLAKMFDRELEKAHRWDISDLVPKAFDALLAHPELAAAFNVQALLLDEFQDTTLLQFKFISRLLGNCRNFFAVGAPSQSIYRFRSADPTLLAKEISNFFGGITITRLTVNYRSGQNIFKAASSMVLAAPDIEGVTSIREGGEVWTGAFEDVTVEANFVATTVRQIQKRQVGIPYRDFAVLFRNWRQSEDIQKALNQAGIPYQFSSNDQLPFWETPKVAALTCYLEAIQAIREPQRPPPGLEGILNQPERGISTADRSKILNGASRLTWGGLIEAMNAKRLDPDVREALKALFELLVRLANCGIEKPDALAAEVLKQAHWLDMIADDLDFPQTRRLLEKKFIHEASGFSDLPTLLEYAARQAGRKWNTDGVMLSTVHSAKGLQFPVVFMIGMNEGSFPSRQAVTQADLEEEARIAHVAASRAMDLLVCTWAKHQTTSYGTRPAAPSRYLAGIIPVSSPLGPDRELEFLYNSPPAPTSCVQAMPGTHTAGFFEPAWGAVQHTIAVQEKVNV